MGKINLTGCPNTRDLGGMITKDGRRIREKKLIRSGRLYNATKEDLEILTKEYELKEVIDFRTYAEIDKYPDPDTEGVVFYKNPIIEELAQQPETDEQKKETHNPVQEALDRANSLPDDVKEFMIKIYPELVENEVCVRGYQKFFRYLSEHEEGSVLWHCSEGKDRVGIGTMLLLAALGVDMDTIKRDYIYTNNCIYQEVTMLLGTISRLVSDHLVEDKILYAMTVREEYLQSVLDSIEKNYGSIDGFLHQALKLTDSDLEMLREKYLED
jgi:protein-tyrosine phosphatase